MALSAFQGQDALREEALLRLAARAEAKQLTGGQLQWDAATGTGSVAGCLAESADPADWEARLGLARWMALALDTVTGRLGASRAATETAALLRAIPVGRDTSLLGSALIVRLLDIVVAERAPGGDLPEILAGLTALHQRCLRGETVAAADWRQLRRAAVAATDALVPPPAEGVRLEPDDARARAIGITIESAAWDPRSSASAVSEVLRQWLSLEGLKADAEFGWTNADDALIRQRLGEMHAKYIAPHPEEKRTVFDFLEIDHAETATRLRAYIKHGGDHGATCCERACALLRRLLEEAS